MMHALDWLKNEPVGVTPPQMSRPPASFRRNAVFRSDDAEIRQSSLTAGFVPVDIGDVAGAPNHSVAKVMYSRW